MTNRLLLLLGCLLCLGCVQAPRSVQQAITIFCGSASKPAMDRVAASFEAQSGIDAEVIFGGSGTLLSQMELSGKGEIYMPGSPDYVLIGERRGQLIPDSDRVVAYLVPAIVTPAGNPAGIQSLQGLARPDLRVGIGNPETVCLGLYSVELLESAGLLDAVLPNVVTFGASCSKTANLSAMAQVDAVLGWRVFEHWNPERMQQLPVAPEIIPRISTVPVAIPVHTRDRELSERFIEHLLSPASLAIFEAQGYLTQREAALALAPRATIGGEYTLPDDFLQRLAQAREPR